VGREQEIRLEPALLYPWRCRQLDGAGARVAVELADIDLFERRVGLA